jgi:predicted TIM-barrel fold metal-dependent hydrolase
MLNDLNPKACLDLTRNLDDRTIAEVETHVKPGFEDTIFGRQIPMASLKVIIQKYMDKMMEGITLTTSDFFGLRHAGCGRLNPVMDVDGAEEDNRRVTFFLFDQGNLPQLPCDNHGVEPCKRQCGQYFRNPGGTYRLNEGFACAFYDSLARDCENEAVSKDVIAMDGHMHFMSGHTTPLPVLWVQFPLKPHFPRGFLDGLGSWVLRNTFGKIPIPKVAGAFKAAWYQKKSTLELADMGMGQTRSVYDTLYFSHPHLKNGGKLYTPMAAMTMDTAYAHYDGYKGIPIYNLVKERKYVLVTVPDNSDMGTGGTTVKLPIWPDHLCSGRTDLFSEEMARKHYPGAYIGTETLGQGAKKEGFYFFRARNAQLDEKMSDPMYLIEPMEEMKKRTPVWLYDQERDLFEDWLAQKEATLTAAIKHPLSVLPLYHYDPRRFSALENPDPPLFLDAYDPPKNWDEPFESVATPLKSGTFVGFKMYTALGYKPFDPKLKATLSKFYGKCQAEGIPVLCHCSPGGVVSIDRDLHFNVEDPVFRKYYQYNRRSLIRPWIFCKDYWMENGYYDAYVRPSAWEEVLNLKHFPKLKLCLAHFGGGSDAWATWSHDTLKKSLAALKKKKTASWNSNVTLSTAEKDALISEWFDEKKHTGDEDDSPKVPNWINELTKMMRSYENLYTDISFHIIEHHRDQLTWLLRNHPHVKDRILFGTDWYMTEIDGHSITKFVSNAKKALDEISVELEAQTGIKDDLWLRFSRTNPFAFYGIRAIADNFVKGLKEAVPVLNNKPGDKSGDKRQGREKIILDHSILERNHAIIKRSDVF